METESAVKFSIVVPLYNEEGSVDRLHCRLTHVMRAFDQAYEIIFVDDGSSDQTAEIIEDLSGIDPSLRVITLGRNFGQTAALKAGFDAARGDVIISMDGDLQHDPAEIPRFIEKLDEGFDIVSGWREKRNDTWLTRRLPSRIANWTMAQISGVPLHDFGTTFKAYRKETIQSIPLYGELHRFIPALAAWSGARIVEIPITNPPRQYGKSNYGISRTFRVFLDLLSTKFLLDYSTKPLHFFGVFGVLATGLGGFSGILLLLQKLIFHRQVFASNIALAIAAAVMFVAGVQILCLGLASEMLCRTYYESQQKPIYAIRSREARQRTRIQPAFAQPMPTHFQEQRSAVEVPAAS